MFLPKPTTANKVNAVIAPLVEYFSLRDYGIVWDDGERPVPEIWMMHPARRFTYFALLSLYEFATRYTVGKRVLDFGCGVGYGTYYLASRGAEMVYGIEIDEKSYRYACDRYKHDRLRFDNRPIESFSGEFAGQFDFIYCSNVMEHIKDYMGSLRGVNTLLAPDGSYLQITPPSGKARGNPYHVTNFTVPEWAEILKDIFPKLRYFAHIPLRERDDTNNEFEFRFEECGPTEMRLRGSIGGMILCIKEK